MTYYKKKRLKIKSVQKQNNFDFTSPYIMSGNSVNS